jgi:hypothetical protein
MKTAHVRLISSMWLRQSSGDKARHTDEVEVYDLRPLEDSGDEQIMDEMRRVNVAMMIDLDGLLYRVRVDGRVFSEARWIVEDVITSRYATAYFDEDGTMRTLEVNELMYPLSAAELIGPSGEPSASDGVK